VYRVPEPATKISPSLFEYLTNSENLRRPLNVIDYKNPSLIGYKKIAEDQLVQYLFAAYLRSDVILSEEGGVNIVLDPCRGTIIYGNYFGLP
jgi:hypothetical protein